MPDMSPRQLPIINPMSATLHIWRTTVHFQISLVLDLHKTFSEEALNFCSDRPEGPASLCILLVLSVFSQVHAMLNM